MIRWRGPAAAACIAAIAVLQSPTLDAAEPNRAGLVVRSADGEVARMCVFFDELQISGLDLLERSALPLVTDRSSLGAAICKLGNKGCATGDCFCRYPTFWGYWVHEPKLDEWTFSEVGAADRMIRNGDVDGWSFGKDGKPPPGNESFKKLCGPGARDAATTAAAGRKAAAPLAQPVSNTRGNYLGFGASVALFTSAGAGLWLMQRRRLRPPRADL